MRYLWISLLLAILVPSHIKAQQIAAVSGAGVTTVFDDLNEAIEKAEEGSTIYLPGCGYVLNPMTKITKRLTIMGSGHKATTENVDGNTTLSGDLQFGEGSDGSAVMGVFMAQGIKIGVDGQVRDITVKYCNVDNIEVKKDSCAGITIEQNFVRSSVEYRTSTGKVCNNVINNLYGVNGGIVSNNVISGTISINNSTFTQNLHWNGVGGSNNIYQHSRQGNFSEIIEKWDGANPNSNFHYVEDYDGDTLIGLYGGAGFDDNCQPPLPFIISKKVAEMTDAQGELSIEVTVKSK